MRKLLITLLCAWPVGCDSTAQGKLASMNEYLCFSPDGRTMAYSRTRVAFSAALPTADFSAIATIRWCPVSLPQRWHTVEIHSETGVLGRGARDVVEDLIFSPDSKHLAVVTRRKIEIIEMATGKHRSIKIPRHRPQDVAWAAANELRYYVITPPQRGTTVRDSRLKIYRQKIKEGAPPRQLYEGDARSHPLDSGWSPDGRYVVLGPAPWGQCAVLDLETKATHQFGPEIAMLRSVSWRRDSSHVFCSLEYLQRVHQSSTRVVGSGFILIKLVKSGVKEQRRWVFPGRAATACTFTRNRTAEDKYVIDSTGWASCSLICPEPWEQIQLKDKLIKKFKLTHKSGPPRIHPLAVPGWLWTRGPYGKSYALDYQATTFVKISDVRNWAISGDGRLIAEVRDDGEVSIKELALPKPKQEREQNQDHGGRHRNSTK